MVSLGFQQLNDPYYQGMAAQIAFYFMLSLVPMVILISQIMGAVLGTTLDEAIGWILDNAEGTLGTTLKSLLTYKSGGFTNIVYIIIALWAASRAQFSMMRINNFINTEGWSTGLLDNPAIWLYLRWPIALVMFFMVISVYYYTMPEKKVKIREIIPGSIFASAGLLLVTFCYSRYTSSVANYDIIYGSLATIVALMFWFFFLAWVFCLGMLFNKVWKDTKKSN